MTSYPKPDPRVTNYAPAGSDNRIRVEIIDLGTHKIGRLFTVVAGKDIAYIDFNYVEMEAARDYLSDQLDKMQKK